MNDFTILHLSDLHIEPIRKKNILMENLLKDIADEMKYSNDILVVVTGDIVNKSNYEAKKEGAPGGQVPLTKCEHGVRTIFGPNAERC